MCVLSVSGVYLNVNLFGGETERLKGSFSWTMKITACLSLISRAAGPELFHSPLKYLSQALWSLHNTMKRICCASQAARVRRRVFPHLHWNKPQRNIPELHLSMHTESIIGNIYLPLLMYGIDHGQTGTCCHTVDDLQSSSCQVLS